MKREEDDSDAERGLVYHLLCNIRSYLLLFTYSSSVSFFGSSPLFGDFSYFGQFVSIGHGRVLETGGGAKYFVLMNCRDQIIWDFRSLTIKDSGLG